MDEVHRRLEAIMPAQVGATIVHGDYRLGNMLVSRDAQASPPCWIGSCARSVIRWRISAT